MLIRRLMAGVPIRQYVPASVRVAPTVPKEVVVARSEPAGSSVKEPSGESQIRNTSARATTIRAAAALDVRTVKVSPARVTEAAFPEVAARAGRAGPSAVSRAPSRVRIRAAAVRRWRTARGRRVGGAAAALTLSSWGGNEEGPGGDGPQAGEGGAPP